ncbi:response regulator [Ancylobacter terrae]|uniref:response regulator n=1 Tax=Ancylobacter sp. sgz301288 TaxID=3342077 RepID=UPI0038595848
MRLLLVEDEFDLARLLTAGLRQAGFAVDHVASLGEAEAALAVERYDIAVLDLRLPDGDGLDFLRSCRGRGMTLPVLILTARDSIEDRIRGLEGGGDDYVLKPFHVDEVIARLRALLRRPNQALGDRLAMGNLVYSPADLRVVVNGEAVALSRREIGLLDLFMRRAGRVVTKEAIESALYSFDEELGSNAVEVLVHRLRRKLQAVGAEPVIHTLRGIGYLMDEVRP